jgi:hypothetical protein
MVPDFAGLLGQLRQYGNYDNNHYASPYHHHNNDDNYRDSNISCSGTAVHH